MKNRPGLQLTVFLVLITALSFSIQGPGQSLRADEESAAEAARSKALAATRMIDARIDQAINKAGLKPAKQASDEAIIRRLSLDLNGVIPPPELVVAFLKYRKKSKRSMLIEKMIQSPRFDTHFANVFTQAWVGRRRRRRSGEFIGWLTGEIRSRKPYTEIVKQVVMEQGKANYFARRWGRDPINLAAQSTRVFMGVQIQCAQCHDHPFTDWKQDQFHHYAAYFGKDEEPYRYLNKVTGVEKQFAPKFLYDTDTKLTEAMTKRQKVATWMTGKDNPYFARMAVNRIWKSMFGRGLVEPVEDLEGTTGYHPMLLQFLAEDFMANDFDIRHLVRAIVYSRAYQRGSRRSSGYDPAADFEKVKDSGDAEARELASMKAQQEVWLFARASLRPLTPIQIVDSLLRATGKDPLAIKEWTKPKPKPAPKAMKGKKPDPKKKKKKPAGPSKEEKAYNNTRLRLLRTFERLYNDDGGASNPDAFDGTVPQTLNLFNGKFINEAIGAKKGTMMYRILRNSKGPKQVIEQLFLAVLSRYPTKTESRLFRKYLRGKGASVETCEDIMWALINSSDFVMNH